MSIIGTGTTSLRKQDVAQQIHSGTAYKTLVFAHKATLGATGVDFTALVQPPEMASLGFTNPASSDILSANILFYKTNLTVMSSMRGALIQNLSYTVPTSARINFQGFTAADGEIFTFSLQVGVKDGLNIVDASPVVATGELAVGSTDFVVGTPYEVGKFSGQQVGAVLVFRNGQIQFRNTGNGTSGGNYQEVDAGNGLGSIIRFNNPPLLQTDNIVVWGHYLTQKPDGSMMAAIESLAGQIDKIVPIVADAAGVPTSSMQAAPNNQDLKAFGTTVYNHDVQITSQGSRITAIESRSVTTFQRFTSGSGTYLTPQGVKWLRVRMVGGGGGGSGGGTAGTGGSGGAGGNTTFSSAGGSLSAYGGSGASVSGGTYGGVGGSVLGTLPDSSSVHYQDGVRGSCGIGGSAYPNGAPGGGNPFGSGGGGGSWLSAGYMSMAPGAGGGGGGANNAGNGWGGAGGGSGGYLDVIIKNPLTQYSYAVGAGGTGGSGGTAGYGGGYGAAGIIIVEEYYS